MKKTAIFAALALAVTLGLSSCSSNSSAAPEASSKGPQDGLTNIRCYNMDSVAANYKLLDKLNAESEEMMKNYQAREHRYATELNNMAQNIDQKMRNNTYLTQQSYEADMKKFQDRQNEVQNTMAQLQNEIARQAALQQQQLIDSINNFLKAYNEVNKFDAILVMQPGTYFNPDLDITDEIIRGLNARYTNAEPTDSIAKK